MVESPTPRVSPICCCDKPSVVVVEYAVVLPEPVADSAGDVPVIQARVVGDTAQVVDQSEHVREAVAAGLLGWESVGHGGLPREPVAAPKGFPSPRKTPGSFSGESSRSWELP